MTRNNLNEHLSWLLANIDLSTPNAPTLPPIRDLISSPTASSPTDETVFFTPTAGLSPEPRPNDPFTADLYPTLPTQPSEPRGPGETNHSSTSANGAAVSKVRSQGNRQGEAVAEAENMGRLTSKLNSKRPNLVLRQEQLLSPASTGGASLSNEYHAFVVKNSTQKRATARIGIGSESGRDRLFLTPGPTLSTAYAADTIDLTNGSGRTSPVTVFGSGTRLWREDFASRPEPLAPSENSVVFGSDEVVWREDHASRRSPIPVESNSSRFDGDVMVWEGETSAHSGFQSAKRGKKRKSDQLSRPPPPATMDDFPDIMDLLTDDENLRAPVRQSPSKSPARSKLKTGPAYTPPKPKAATKTPSKQKEAQIHDMQSVKHRTEPALFQTPRKGVAVEKLELSETKLASFLEDSDSIFESDGERAAKQGTKSQRLPLTDERVIQDSDDEDLMTPPRHKLPDDPSLRSGSPSKLPHDSLPEDHIVDQGTPSKPRGLVLSQSVIVARSPQKTDRNRSQIKPIKSTENSKAEEPVDVDFSSQKDEAQYDNEKLSAMLGLLLRQSSIIEAKRMSLEEGLRQNRESFKKSLQEGSKEPRERLRRDKERLLKQQASLDVLLSEYRSYEDLAARRDALIARIADAYEHDLNTEDDETHLQGLDALLKDRQELLKTRLLDAGMIDPIEYQDGETHSIRTGQYESVVQATQAAHSMAPRTWSRESTVNAGMGSTQVIMQTQLPSHSDTNRTTPADIHVSEAFNSQRRARPTVLASPQHATSRKGELVRSTPQPRSDAMDYDGDDLFEDHGLSPSHVLSKDPRMGQSSSRAKGRRSPKRNTALQKKGYESDYSDDIDISELAQEMELQQSSAEIRLPKTIRSALSETSGNVGGRKEKTVAKKRQVSAAAPVSPRQKKFPWYKDVRRALKDRFRMNGFRHNQLAAINATLSGKDAFILMPTGGGKSLCYQLPAVVTSGKTDGITVVVSPLLSLMQDQVEHLRALNIAAAAFNGETPPREKKYIMDTLKDPKPHLHMRLLYVTPEMINKSATFLNGLTNVYRNKKLARLVIDEAHCVSQWGHDFRPDYKQLGNFRVRFPGVPIMALTATATQNVITDVKHNLGIEECELFTQSFNRPNLYYEVLRKEKDNTATIADLINSRYPGMTGIVYTLSRKSAENIAQKLRDQGIAAHHYHASVESQEKVRIQRDWQKGLIKVVVATIAFGMGIDKPDVRFVIHQSVPKSLEGYYQETGRAGRDGEPSECYLYFGYGDVTQLRKLIADGDGNEEQKERQRNMLSTVTAFCDNQSDCRRVEILRYFGETFTKAQCNATCDNCRSKDSFELKDFTNYALAVLEIVKSEGRVTLAQCTDYLIAKKKRTDFSFEVQQFHGMARSLPKHEVHRVVDRLLAEEALTEDNVFKTATRMAVQYFRVSKLISHFTPTCQLMHVVLRLGEPRALF
jgi:bloom syndrome protein